jgi:hypothetical protein
MVKRGCSQTGLPVIAGVLLLAATTQAQIRVLPPTQIPPTGAEDAVPATAVEGAKTLEGLTNRSLAGLTFEQRSDGTISVDLQGRFMHVLMASPGADGRLEVACHAGHGPASATDVAIVPWTTPVRGAAGSGRLDTTGLRAPLKVTISKAPVREVK